MKIRDILSRQANNLAAILVVLGITLSIAHPAISSEAVMLSPEDFVRVAQEGFGGPQNNAAWSMQWWGGNSTWEQYGAGTVGLQRP